MEKFRQLFDLTNPVWQFMSKLSDMMLLTILWALFSIPVITLIPSTIAMYTVADKVNIDSGSSTVREFITAFFKNLKSNFIPGLIILILFIVIITNTMFYQSITADIAPFLLFLVIFIGVILYSLLLYILPLKAMYTMSWKELILNTLMLSVKYLQWTLFLVVINLTVIFVTAYVFPVIYLFSIGGLGLLNTKVTKMLYEEVAKVQV